MAGLKKPGKCDECGSINLHREYHPERWICDHEHIVVSRGVKPQTGVCRDCGKLESEVPFDNHGNICKECKAIYHKQYVQDNQDKLNQQKRDYYVKNHDELRARTNAYWQGSWRAYMSDRFSSTRTTAKARFGKYNRVLEFAITREFIMELLEKQEHKCAITGVEMVHKWGSLKSASIDRIDSSGGYTPDNVQLLCQGINIMKNTRSDEDVKLFLSECYRERTDNG